MLINIIKVYRTYSRITGYFWWITKYDWKCACLENQTRLTSSFLSWSVHTATCKLASCWIKRFNLTQLLKRTLNITLTNVNGNIRGTESYFIFTKNYSHPCWSDMPSKSSIRGIYIGLEYWFIDILWPGNIVISLLNWIEGSIMQPCNIKHNFW